MSTEALLSIIVGVFIVVGFGACILGIVSTFRLAQYQKTDEYQEWRREYATAQRDRWQSIVDSYEDDAK